MKCQKCGKYEANFKLFYKDPITGLEMPLYLCYDCAKELQVGGAVSSTSVKDELQKMLSDMGVSFFLEGLMPTAARSGVNVCPTCGRSIAQYADSGFLGCEDCYKNFARVISDSLVSVQAGTHHVGKVPYSSAVKDNAKKPPLGRDELKNLLNTAIEKGDMDEADKIMKLLRTSEVDN